MECGQFYHIYIFSICCAQLYNEIRFKPFQIVKQFSKVKTLSKIEKLWSTTIQKFLCLKPKLSVPLHVTENSDKCRYGSKPPC